MQLRRLFPLLTALVLLFGSAPIGSAQDSNEALRHAQQAESLGKAKKFDEAIASIKKAIELDPKNHLYLAMASDFEMKAGKFADGLAHAKRAIELDANVGAYYVLAAANAFSDQNLDEATKYCKLVLKRGPSELGQGPCKDASFILSKLAPTTYTFHFELLPRRGRPIRNAYVVALPKGGTDRQTVSYKVSDVRSHRLQKGKVNDMLSIVPKSADPISLTIEVTVKPQSHKQALAKATDGVLPADAKAFLTPSKAINPRSPALLKVVAPLKAKSQRETVTNILAWMKKNIDYKLDSPNIRKLDFETVEEIVERGHAECRGYSMLFTALCRAAGIPARTVWGLARVTADQDQRLGDIASHNWAEVYLSGVGWVPVDPQDQQTFGFLPVRFVQFLGDTTSNPAGNHLFPLVNLLSMHNGNLRFDAKQEGFGGKE